MESIGIFMLNTDKPQKINATGSILISTKKKIYDAPVAASTTLDSKAVSDTGGSMTHEYRPHYITLRACIALVGLYPSRN